MTTLNDRDLFYGTVLVGRVRDIDECSGTWNGTFENVLDLNSGVLARRIAEFIAFCNDWHERLKRNIAAPPDAAEFDQFSDVLKSGLWYTQTVQGARVPIFQAPVFSMPDDVCWRED